MSQPSPTPEANNTNSQVIRTSGYRVDEVGVHDRFLRWRHYGFWKFARSVELNLKSKFILLLFTFEGRKRPLKVDLSKSFKNALKAASILELALSQAPDLLLDPQAQHFLKDISRFRKQKDRAEGEIDGKIRIAKANIFLRLGDSKNAKKEVDPLLRLGGKQEEQARLVRLQAYFLESDSILAHVEYDRICKLNPSSEEANRLWTCWRLARGEDGAEEAAIESINRSRSIEDQLEIESHLIPFLLDRRRYLDALNRIDVLLKKKDHLKPDQLDWLNETRTEIERLNTDQKYNRRVTFWRPLYVKAAVIGIFGFIGILMLGPAIIATPKLWSDLSNLRELSERGLTAQSGKFNPKLRDMDFGFVHLDYVFNVRGSNSRFPSHHGSDVFRRKIAEAILADTKEHSVVYLPESPFVCTTYPITKENFIGVIAIHAPAYLYASVIILVALYFVLQHGYKKLKYGYS